MKKSGTTIVFVLVCVGVLVAAFAIGICIRKIRFGAENKSIATVPEKSPIELAREREQARRMPGNEGTGRDSELSPEQRAALVEQRAGMRDRFENMTDEEREAFRTQMRERFSGRRRDMGPQLQLSDEERAKMREDIDALREKWDQMSEAEREEARNQISEKYGFTPRGLGGGRGFGDREGSGRRSFIRPGDEQTQPDEEQTQPDEEQTQPDEEQSENN
jgi:Spy/CpxP family protein refolding chaperone